MLIEAVTATAAVSWLWDKFGSDIADKSGEATKAAWKRLNWITLSQKYRDHVRASCGTTTLLGNPKQIDLSKVFTDVFVYDKLAAYRRLELDVKGIKSETHFEELLGAKRLPLLTVAAAAKRLYVLGKPGAGKSTFLRKLVLEACDGKIDRTPIFVGLRAWTDSGLPLMEYMQREFSICAFPDAEKFLRRLLENGKALVLFDGLDEVNKENEGRGRAISVLADFSRQYVECNIVVTCRVAATDYSFAQFRYVEIADFTAHQKLEFAKKWYEDHPKNQAAFLKGWNSPDSDRFRDLARTPLLLALLCLAFDETLQFPTRRVELYQEAFNALLRRWDSSRGISRDSLYKHLSHIRREQLLSRLAARMFFKGVFLIPQFTLVNHIREHLLEFPQDVRAEAWDPEVIVQSIAEQHGLLVERLAGTYAFSHLTFQEYLTAKHIVENIHDHAILNEIAMHVCDDQWKEVFLMVASLLDSALVLFSVLQRSMKTLLLKNPELVTIFNQLEKVVLHSSDIEASFTPRWHSERCDHAEDWNYSVTCALLSELALELAAHHTFARGRESLPNRVRVLAAGLQTQNTFVFATLAATKSYEDEKRVCDSLIEYLKIANLYCECLELAVVPDRTKLGNVILSQALLRS